MSQDQTIIYEAANSLVLGRVPKASKRVLDVGCGSGALGAQIKQQNQCHVVGITHSEAEAAIARNRLDEVLISDLNNFEVNGMKSFDCIVCSHVLEHLVQPEQLLKRMRHLLSADGILVVALPNTLFWQQRLEFIRGRFRYSNGGIMDRTHYRFFDWVTARELLQNSGYTVVEAVADGGFPLSRFLSGVGRWLDRASLKLYPGLFGFQFIFVCRPESDPQALRTT